MARPQRTFTGQEGQRSTGTAGPDAIRNDFDAAFAMFNPDDTLPDGQAGGIGSDNMKPGAATDEIIGQRTVSDGTAPNSNTGFLTGLLSGIVNRIRAITGQSSWRSNPPTTLAAAKQHMDADAPHPGHETPAGAQAKVDAHANNKNNPHNTTAAQTGALVSVAGISNPGGGVDIVAGTGISVSKDATNKRVTITAQGGQAPGKHASTHGSGGSDPITPAMIGAATAGHTHSELPTSGQKAALAGTSGTPSNTNRYVTNSDPRLSDARTPTSHTHDAADITSGTFSTSRIPNLPASKITSGTFDVARLPSASTSARGAVQLTTSRTSTSTSLALTASAMNSHRTSSDHDGRYYTKSEVDALLANAGGAAWVQPSNTILAESLRSKAVYGWEDGENAKLFSVLLPGRYRVTGEARRLNTYTNTARVVLNTVFGYDPSSRPQFSTSSTSFVSFTLDTPETYPLKPGDTIAVSIYADDEDGRVEIRNVRVRGSIGQPTAKAWAWRD